MPNPFAAGHARYPSGKLGVALGLELHDPPDDHARLSPVAAPGVQGKLRPPPKAALQEIVEKRRLRTTP
jgi:hypothetical protein